MLVKEDWVALASSKPSQQELRLQGEIRVELARIVLKIEFVGVRRHCRSTEMKTRSTDN